MRRENQRHQAPGGSADADNGEGEALQRRRGWEDCSSFPLSISDCFFII